MWDDPTLQGELALVTLAEWSRRARQRKDRRWARSRYAAPSGRWCLRGTTSARSGRPRRAATWGRP